jgi:hypothetical protein
VFLKSLTIAAKSHLPQTPNSLELFFDLLQLQLQQFSPDDAIFRRPSKVWVFPVIACELDVLQMRERLLDPGASSATKNRSRRRLASRQIQRTELTLPIHVADDAAIDVPADT